MQAKSVTFWGWGLLIQTSRRTTLLRGGLRSVNMMGCGLHQPSWARIGFSTTAPMPLNWGRLWPSDQHQQHLVHCVAKRALSCVGLYFWTTVPLPDHLAVMVSLLESQSLPNPVKLGVQTVWRFLQDTAVPAQSIPSSRCKGWNCCYGGGETSSIIDRISTALFEEGAFLKFAQCISTQTISAGARSFWQSQGCRKRHITAGSATVYVIISRERDSGFTVNLLVEKLAEGEINRILAQNQGAMRTTARHHESAHISNLFKSQQSTQNWCSAIRFRK